MHPRNRYRDNKPDFGELGDFHPPLKPFLLPQKRSHTYTLDFSNPEALRELTRGLLAKDFGLKLEIPLNKLIPTVSVRLNYIHWLEDLLSGPGDDTSVPKGESVTGIDIGTGASCIYPLLGARLNGWRFLATEIDRESVECAVGNVSRNGLEGKIAVKQVPEDVVLLGAVDSSLQYDFCMCNPPFFKDKQERYGGQSRSGHRPPAATASTGTLSETVTGGGEVEFVKRIINDSLTLKNTVRWYTSMLGRKASLKDIQDELKKHQIPAVTTTEFVQGRTWRWGIAWSFDETLRHKAAHMQHKGKRPRPVTFQVSGSSPATPEGFHSVVQWLQEQFTELQIEHDVTEEEDNSVSFHCKAYKNTWSHQRKKKRLLERLKRGEREPTGPQAQPSGVKGVISSGLKEICHEVDEDISGDPKQQTSLRLEVGQHVGTHGPEATCTTEIRNLPTASELCTTPNLEIAETAIGESKDGSSSVSSIVKPLAPLKYGHFGSKQPQAELPEKEAANETRNLPHILKEIEAMCTPCNVEFQCSVFISKELDMQSKGARIDCKGTKHKQGGNGGVLLSFEWIQGDSKDTLHQLSQYIRNKILQHEFSSN